MSFILDLISRLFVAFLDLITRFLVIIFTPLAKILGAWTAALGDIPFEWARPITCGFILLFVVGVFFLKADYVFLGARERKWYTDLRLWALVISLPYLLIYGLM